MEQNPPEKNQGLRTANQAYKVEKKSGATTLPFKDWIKEKGIAPTTKMMNASGAAEYYFSADSKTPMLNTEVNFIGIPIKTFLTAIVIIGSVWVLIQIVKKSSNT